MGSFLDRVRGLFGGKSATAQELPTFVYEPLPALVAAGMDEGRARIRALLATHIPGARLIAAPADFSLLQQLLDLRLFSGERKDEARALGICFGDALAGQVRGLTWQQVTDEYGTDPTLRYLEYSLQVNTRDMLLKRIERGEEMDLRQMANWLENLLHEQAQEYRRDAMQEKEA
jgi:hypothetical protein